MASRAALLKRNALIIATRTLLTENAINPDRVDLDSVQVVATGDKSVQIRAEVMLTMPMTKLVEGIDAALGEIAVQEAADEAEAEKQRIADQGQAALEETADAEPERDNMDIESAIHRGEDLEPEGDIPVGDADDDGF